MRNFILVVIAAFVTGFNSAAQSNAEAFPFRSMHLDVARHFFPPDVIRQYIDSLAANNYNYFHWHLTDDQGWRIEIKSYPLLTKVGAWRNENNKMYGGFYTQHEVKELVAYAAQKGVEIIPEIDVPGHSSAAIAAYPWLSCTGDSIAVPSGPGIYKTILCPTDTVRSFLKTVLDEVCELFPGRYIHIGGDEVPKKTWRNHPDVEKLMKEQKLHSLQAVQNHWMAELAVYLQNKGKTVIVWGEVTRSDFSKDLVIMSWRGENAGVKAARNGNKVIMASRFYCYFDYPKSRKEKKPAFFYAYLTNSKVARYTLYSNRLSGEQNKNIIGGGGLLWTEYVPDASKLWHQFSPRVATLGRILSETHR